MVNYGSDRVLTPDEMNKLERLARQQEPEGAAVRCLLVTTEDMSCEIADLREVLRCKSLLIQNGPRTMGRWLWRWSFIVMLGTAIGVYVVGLRGTALGMFVLGTIIVAHLDEKVRVWRRLRKWGW